MRNLWDRRDCRELPKILLLEPLRDVTPVGRNRPRGPRSRRFGKPREAEMKRLIWASLVVTFGLGAGTGRAEEVEWRAVPAAQRIPDALPKGADLPDRLPEPEQLKKEERQKSQFPWVPYHRPDMPPPMPAPAMTAPVEGVPPSAALVPSAPAVESPKKSATSKLPSASSGILISPSSWARGKTIRRGSTMARSRCTP